MVSWRDETRLSSDSSVTALSAGDPQFSISASAMAKIYPNLEYMSNIPYEKPHSNLETNCGQIFSKTPVITKEFLDIIELKDIAPRKTSICGYVLRTRRIWVLFGLLLLFISSFTGIVIMWFTNVFDQAVLSNFVLTNDTLAYKKWIKPPVKPLFKVYIFNYTNVDDYENGIARKLRVQEIGPYVYEETLEKVNVHFNDDDTFSYQERRSHTFRPDLSTRRKQSDRIVVPNLPLLSAVAMSKHSFYMTRLTLSTVFNTMNVKPFITLPADKFIWGYDDILYTLAKSIISFKEDIPYRNVGLMVARNGTSKDIITVNTGKHNMWKIAYTDSYNEETSLNHWSTKECNKIEGSDGSFFPPYAVRNKQPIYIYKKELCRRIPLVFDKEVNIFNGRVPAYRYVLPPNVFDNEFPENQCYCDLDSGSCPPRGLFNVSACSFKAPVFISNPHFYNSDPILLKSVDGLSPDQKKHDTFADLNKFGFPMVVSGRMQINVQVMKPFGISQVNMFRYEMYLPVAWIEVRVDEKDVPNELMDLINTLSFTIPNTEAALKYGSILTSGVTFVAILIVLRNQWLEGQEELGNC